MKDFFELALSLSILGIIALAISAGLSIRSEAEGTPARAENVRANSVFGK